MAGTVAIMKAYTCCQVSFEEIEKILKSTATDIGINGMGAGLINSGLAIQKTKYMSFKNEQDMITSIKVGKTYYYKIRGYMNYNQGKKYCQYSTIKSAKTK